MHLYADLHLHGRHSRGCSTELSICHLERWARIKGLGLLGTGDFTHPAWLGHLRESLREDGSGILRSSSGFPFVLQAELSNIWSQGHKLRKVHNVVLAPSFEIVEQINEALAAHGKLSADGRPVFGSWSCAELVDELLSIDRGIEIIPAHAWTPWFSIFGSNSGFDSVEECFGDSAKHIYALETGMSSDPAMNWRLSALDRFTLLSNSDSHSFWPWRIGRECNIFELGDGLNYEALIKAIRTREGFVGTVEVDPSYGKYHFTGHRNCGFVCSPGEALKLRNRCPVCGRQLTVGVAQRVEALADRPEGFRPENAQRFWTLLPLSELIAGITRTTPATQRVWQLYNRLIERFGSEFAVLLGASETELVSAGCNRALAAAVIANRDGRIKVRPGFDGQYGVLLLDENQAAAELDGIKKAGQAKIGDF